MELNSDALVSAFGSADTQDQLHGLIQLQTAIDTPEDAINLLQQHSGILTAVVKLMHSAADSEVQCEAVRAICMLMGAPEDPVNQDIVGSAPKVLDNLTTLLSVSDEETQRLACIAVKRLAFRRPALQDRVGAAPGILEGLVSLLASDNVDVQKAAAAALTFIAAGHQPNQGRIGAMPLVIPHLASLLYSSDCGVQQWAAAVLHALADVHLDNRKRIVQSGAVPILAALLSSSNTEVQAAAVAALFNMCSIQPQKADWIDNCSGAIEGFVSLLDQQEHPTSQAYAALSMVLLASSNSNVFDMLQQNAAAVWAAMPSGVMSMLGLHHPEVMELLRALQKHASSSQAMKQSMQDSPQLLLMLEAMKYGCNQEACDVVQQLLDMLSAGEGRYPNSSRPASSVSSEGSPDPWCPCCQDTPKQLVFRCGHATCEGCRAQLNPPNCPVCRRDISAFQLRLFL